MSAVTTKLKALSRLPLSKIQAARQRAALNRIALRIDAVSKTQFQREYLSVSRASTSPSARCHVCKAPLSRGVGSRYRPAQSDLKSSHETSLDPARRSPSTTLDKAARVSEKMRSDGFDQPELGPAKLCSLHWPPLAANLKIHIIGARDGEPAMVCGIARPIDG